MGVAEAAVGSLFAAGRNCAARDVRAGGWRCLRRQAILLRRIPRWLGLGAIVGAPLMLSTIRRVLLWASRRSVFRQRRLDGFALQVVREDARRDLAFFIPVFLGLVIAGRNRDEPVGSPSSRRRVVDYLCELLGRDAAP